MRKQKGFSLIELLVVVAIIATLAAIAIPSLMKARIAANQASAVGSIHAIMTADVNFHSIFGGFASSLAALGGSPQTCGMGNAAPSKSAACLIDSSLADATTPETAKSGYYFTYTGTVEAPNGTVQSYEITATPADLNTTGDLAYHADPSMWEAAPQVPVPANANDLPANSGNKASAASAGNL
ncbi:MAG: putative Pilin, type [Acidobacteriales bacterium]|nr:putative Pilin, type [Terriglobales bacterium]